MRLKNLGAGYPCVYLRFSGRLGRLLPLRPAVDCGGDCGGCPWNPAEQKRRLALGVWRRGGDGLLRLCFPPIPSGEGADPLPPESATDKKERRHYALS